MEVDEHEAAGTVQHGGMTYYFCNDSCVERFRADPASYLGPRREAPAAAPGTRYTCPMHPEIVRDGPGACPICGMALEPAIVSLDDEPNPELADMTRRFRIAAVLTLPVFVAAMGDMALGGRVTMAAGRWLNWMGLLLATPVVFWAGRPFFERGWASIVHRSPNMFTLIALGVGAAYVFSAAATIAPGAFPEGFRMHGSVETYFDTASVITVLVLLGQVLELRARSRTSRAIRQLLELAPATARVVRNGADLDVPAGDVRVGDICRLRPGDRVPVDGVVLEGRSAIDESMVTGEPMPVEKEPRAPVTAGTINTTGTLLFRAERVGHDTLLAQIVRMVGEAQRSRAPIQRLADRISAYFVPAVVVVALASFAAWSLWGPEPRFAHALVNAVAVLIIACPCALGLATPMAIMVGTGRGALAGVLVRQAEALERLERVDTLLADKTGTLTEGKPALASIAPLNGWSEERALSLAAGLEQGSEHPVAAAILAGARTRAVAPAQVDGFQAEPGRGVRGRAGSVNALLGNAALMHEAGLSIEPVADWTEARRREGQTMVYLAADGRLVAVLGVADPVKPASREAVRALQGEGIRVVMLTGDHRTTAEAVAARLGIEEVHAEVQPADKRAIVQAMQRAGHLVAMAGDGINDAPALAEASVGIAMGTGTDVAIESAAITLVKGDIRGIVRARRLSRATMRNIRQNLFLAFAYNAVGIPVAAGVLYP